MFTITTPGIWYALTGSNTPELFRYKQAQLFCMPRQVQMLKYSEANI
jgi:hypothetical protein